MKRGAGKPEGKVQIWISPGDRNLWFVPWFPWALPNWGGLCDWTSGWSLEKWAEELARFWCNCIAVQRFRSFWASEKYSQLNGNQHLFMSLYARPLLNFFFWLIVWENWNLEEKGTVRSWDPLASFPGGSVVKNLPPNAGDAGSIPGLGRSPGEENGNPLQYSCLGNLMGREAWQATVCGVVKESDTI